jgi:hypothetical protein
MAVLRGNRAHEKAAGLERDIITTRAEAAAGRQVCKLVGAGAVSSAQLEAEAAAAFLRRLGTTPESTVSPCRETT